MGFTVVGKPAATVITSSPGTRRRSAQLGRGQRRQRQQVGRRSGIHQQALAHAAPAGELALEAVCETSRGQPEIQRRIHQRPHFRRIEHLARHRHLAGPRDELPRRERPRRSTRPPGPRIRSRRLSLRPSCQELPVPGDGALQALLEIEQRGPGQLRCGRATRSGTAGGFRSKPRSRRPDASSEPMSSRIRFTRPRTVTSLSLEKLNACPCSSGRE